MTDILDIEGIYGISWKPVIWIALSILLAGILLGLIFIIKKIIKNKIFKRKPLSPSRYGLKEIEKLKKQNLLQKGELRKFYFFLSDILRRYITDQFDYMACDKTTREIETEFLNTLEPDLGRNLGEFLGRSDLVKFGNHMVSLESARTDLERVENAILKTRDIGNQK